MKRKTESQDNQDRFNLHRPPSVLPLTEVVYEPDCKRISIGYCEAGLDTYLMVMQPHWPRLLAALLSQPGAKAMAKTAPTPSSANILELLRRQFTVPLEAASPYSAIKALLDAEQVPYQTFYWEDSD